jgi:hypothetical protein
VVLADRVKDLVRQRCAELRDGSFAGRLDVPIEPNASRLENPDGGVADFGTHAVARNQRYCVSSQSV